MGILGRRSSSGADNGHRAPEGRPADPHVDDSQRLSPAEVMGPNRALRPNGDPSDPGGDGEGRRATVISFANQKGGVAKTTTTLNLAVAFSESGHQVLAVDLDPQGNLTMSQGIDPDKVEKSMYDVLVDRTPIREVIHQREVDLAVSSIDLAGAEIAMSTQIGRERSLEKALGAVLDDYDFVCIDTPPSLGLLTVNALTASDKVIVPVQCEYLSMRGLVQLQNTLQMIRENLNPGVEIEGILPTMLDSRTVHAKEAVEILEENFGELVFKSRIRKAIKFAEAPVRGTSVLKYDPKGNAANYYRELAEEVLNGAS
jgi:chromosome partitioning protein